MADQTETVDQGTPDGGVPEGGGSQFDALTSHMEQMSAKLDQLVPQQQQGPTFGQITDPNYDPYPDLEQFDQSYGQEPDYGQYQQQYEQQQYDPSYGQQPQQQQQVDPNAALQWIQQQIQEGVQQQVAPFMAQQRAREIEGQYPDLAKPETIQQIAPVAQQLAANMGMGPDGWRNPDFLLMVYQAQQGQQTASQQIAAEDQQPGQEFEGGGAGAPDAGEPNLAERILNAYPHGSAAQFWGA